MCTCEKVRDSPEITGSESTEIISAERQNNYCEAVLNPSVLSAVLVCLHWKFDNFLRDDDSLLSLFVVDERKKNQYS